MRGRGAARRRDEERANDQEPASEAVSVQAPPPDRCWLCGRALGLKVEWHHPRPKSRGGTETAPVHPICHRALHATFTNVELANDAAGGIAPATRPELEPFMRWIAGKPPDFNAPTRKRRG